MVLEISLGSILAIAVAGITYLLARKERKPAFVYEVATLHSKSHPEATITFQDEEVENLTRLRFAFFNAGRKEIRKEDIPKSGYPKVIFPGTAKVLSSEIVAVSKPEIDLSLLDNGEREVEITFDFLNRNDGAVIEVIFDDIKVNAKPKFKATIKGGNSPTIRNTVTTYMNQFKFMDFIHPISPFLMMYVAYQILLEVESYSAVWVISLFSLIAFLLIACISLYRLYLIIFEEASLPPFAVDHFQT